jgi:hypothetical protein
MTHADPKTFLPSPSHEIVAIIRHIGCGRRGDRFIIENSHLNLSVTGIAPSTDFCRAVMADYPEYAEYSLKVVDEQGVERFTVANIGRMSTKMFTDSGAQGPRLVKYREFSNFAAASV